jgi:NADH-quinone oxidoreductase subunit C
MTITDQAEQSAPEPTPPEPAPPASAQLHGCVLVTAFGQQVVHVPREQYLRVVKALLADGYEMCVDLTAVDYLLMPERHLPDGITPGRFEVVVNLLSLTNRQRIRVRVQIPADDVAIPTLFDMYPGTEAMEREAYDMFGIVFTDHPDLSRILMPEDWDGYPLRKDYEIGRIPVQFKIVEGA